MPCIRLALVCLLGVQAWAETSLFAKPGRKVDVGSGSTLSLYCIGKGVPTIVLESGFGGGTAATWMRLQPLLGALTRTCSYDRAGYGFSTLGRNLPRDLNRAVAELAALLKRSGEKRPYLLAGHSNGGLMIGAYADLYPERVAGLAFFDAAVVLPDDGTLPTASPAGDVTLELRLEKIRRCLARAEVGLVPAAGDECVNPDWYSMLPRDLAAAEVANRAKADYWRAYLSEAEHNFSSRISAQARALLPHKWAHLPVRIFVASVSEVDDEAAARSFGIEISDKSSLAEARVHRARGEQRQEAVCAFVKDCRVTKVRTANHLVHNEVLRQVVEVFRELVRNVRRSRR